MCYLRGPALAVAQASAVLPNSGERLQPILEGSSQSACSHREPLGRALRFGLAANDAGWYQRYPLQEGERCNSTALEYPRGT